MYIAEYQLAVLKRAYRILGVPLSASALSIKQTYRRLIRRWHPDLHARGSPSQVDATQMTQLISQAYSEIKHAPLRYYIGADRLAQEGNGESACRPSEEPIHKHNRTVPRTDRLEFWVRFVCGALFGSLVGFRLVLSFFEYSIILILAFVAVILGFGFAAARYGDRFWHSILRLWWFWS
jgi:hypothetical protein